MTLYFFLNPLSNLSFYLIMLLLYTAICTILATLNAMGIILRLRGALANITITTTLNWRDVMEKYNKALNCVFDGVSQLDKAWGRMHGVLNVVKRIGVLDNVRTKHIQSSNLCQVASHHLTDL